MSTENTFFEVPVGFKTRFTLGDFKADVKKILWSPDGKLLASGHFDGSINLWDFHTGTLKQSFKGFEKLLSIAWSPDGRTLASSETERGICFWDLYTGGLSSTISWHYNNAIRLEWSPDGRSLAMLMNNGTLQSFQRKTGDFTPLVGTSHDSVSSFAWSPDGATLACGYSDGTISVLNHNSGEVIYKFTGHAKSVTDLAWSPDGLKLASSSKDRTVRLWHLSDKQQSTILEGHTAQVNSVFFSADGRLLASRSSNRDILFWRCDTATKVCALKEIATHPDDSDFGAIFHPHQPVLALIGKSYREIYIWDFKSEIVFNIASSDPTFRYTNAKVVLVGNSGVGKSGLGLALSGQPFIATESTHGRHVWIIDTHEVELLDGRKETRETLLWDLAGQPGYRLIHQLHLNEVAVALVVFDMRSETDPFSGVRHWDRALRQSQRVQGSNTLHMKKFLIAARADRGGVGVSQARLEAVKNDLGFDKYFETSAKEGWNIPQLEEEICKSIDWEALPKVVSTALFQRIKSFLIEEKQARRVLSTTTGLYRTFLKTDADLEDSEELFAQFETCVGRVESRGLIKRLSFGNLILLQPELLDAYASSIINAAKDEPDGLGSIAEEDVLTGRFRMSKDERIQNKEQERLLLIATVEEMFRHEITLREHASDGLHLVFPSQLTRENPDLPDPPGRALTFSFEGPVQNVYATLIVRLSHSGFFKKHEMWKNAASFRVATSGTCGVFLRDIDEGRAELTLFFDKHSSKDTKYNFEEFIHTHLLRHALPETISRRQIVVCAECGFIVTAQLLQLRTERGFDWVDCPGCESKLSLRESHEQITSKQDSVVSELDRAADNQREFDAGLTSAAGEMRTTTFKQWAGASSTTIAIAFTDIVDSTKLATQLGNEAMNKVRRAHFNRGRQLIEKFGGYQIKTIGDSLMAAFRTAVSALDFVMEFRRDTGDERLKIRSGIHVGPVHIDEEDAFGTMINYAARVIGLAEGPEMWLSNLAKDHIDQEKADRHAQLKWHEYPGNLLKGFAGYHTLWSDREHRKSTFISYSSNDQEFVEQIYNDLQNNGIRCWFAPADLKTGDRFRTTIDEALLVTDKLLLVLSEHSINSHWVEKEVETAIEREAVQKRTILFPIRVDDAVTAINTGWPADVRRTRHIGDFTLWKDNDSYRKAFDRLLRDLKAKSGD